jgi:hypothetical protein
MASPFADRVSPSDAAQVAALRGRFHDVVVAASKVVHEQVIDKQDRLALKWASEMLAAAQAKDVLLAMPSAHELSGQGNVILAIRRATDANGDDSTEAIRQLTRGVSDVLRGRHTDLALQSMESLRAVFAAVSRIALQAEVSAHGDPESRSSWAPLMTISAL